MGAMLLQKMRSIWRNNGGSALIETALILPVLIIFIFGVLEFSWLICQQHMISAGISDAARYIARSSTPNNPTISQDAKNLATTGAVDGTVLRVRGWRADDVDISYSIISNPAGNDGLTDLRGGPAIESVTVSTTFTVPSLGFFNILGLSPPTFRVLHQERVIGSG